MSRTEILYKDIAPGAAEDASAAASGASSFSMPQLLPSGLTAPRLATCEKNQWALDAAHTLWSGQNAAFWSGGFSGKDCRFACPPVITFLFDEQYSSTGMTLFFAQDGFQACTKVNIKWYQDGALKADAMFYPDSAAYFCRQTVSSYDKIELTLMETARPYSYARLEKVIFGVHRIFGMDEIRSASVVNEVGLLSTEVPVSTLRWTLDSKEEVDYLFQLKQPVEVHNDAGLIGVYYIDGYRRVSRSVYEIDCYDAVGALGESTFPGGVYTNYSARQLMRDIVGDAFALAFEAEDRPLSGILQKGTRRDAVRQVLFAWGACASTDGGESIRVFVPDGSETVIGQDRIYTGVSVDTAAIVTEVRVAAHSYVRDDNGSVEIGGGRYRDTETVYTVTNPNATAADKQNVVEIRDATLVSPSIGQETAQRVYDYYLCRNTSRAKLIWGGERLGDAVRLPNTWGKTNGGRLKRMEIRLSNTVAASCEAVGP